MNCYYTLTFHIFAQNSILPFTFCSGTTFLFISHIDLFCRPFFGSSLCLLFTTMFGIHPFSFSCRDMCWFILYCSYKTLSINNSYDERKIWFVDNPSYNANQFSMKWILQLAEVLIELYYASDRGWVWNFNHNWVCSFFAIHRWQKSFSCVWDSPDDKHWTFTFKQ